jgi:hypothetical protein
MWTSWWTRQPQQCSASQHTYQSACMTMTPPRVRYCCYIYVYYSIYISGATIYKSAALLYICQHTYQSACMTMTPPRVRYYNIYVYYSIYISGATIYMSAHLSARMHDDDCPESKVLLYICILLYIYHTVSIYYSLYISGTTIYMSAHLSARMHDDDCPESKVLLLYI